MDVATEERKNIEAESTHLRDHHGRIPDRVGCSDGPTVHTRQMDSHSEIEPHQLPVLIALQQWEYQLKNQTVLLQLDNTTAVAYLLKEGGTQSRSLRYLAAEILILADHHNISVRPSYMPDQMSK